MTAMTMTLRRVGSFMLQIIEGGKVAWGLAVMNDCRLNGGHRWGPADPDCLPLMGPHVVCTRCGCAESRSQPAPMYIANTEASNTHYRISFRDCVLSPDDWKGGKL